MMLSGDTVTEYTSMVAFGIIGLVLGLQRITKYWKTNNAETSVISLMHEELERMAAQNTRLTEELNKLQLEILALNTQLRTLTDENQRLHRQVTCLTSEIARLKTTLDSK